MQTVYIKTELSCLVRNKKITVGDVCQVYAYEEKVAKKVREIELFRISKQEKQKISVSSLYVIRHIMDAVPDIMVVNLGEPDFLLEYKPPVQEKKWMDYLKAGVVGMIVFFGSAFTIMTFNEDANVALIFEKIYQNTGGNPSGNGWLELSYAIGLPLGILLFFNHFASAKLSSDPTPLQIQMRQYEQQEDTTIIENAARKGDRLE
ncbi:MAG: stage V sporulation protein AA [Lachnospiraceae bacterium]|nr:stage V sporulation protein AA [Lachnospiraceae bacterium]MBP3609974.1 stage V sporulation protein AA [Lachnospiraceae bacterium]